MTRILKFELPTISPSRIPTATHRFHNLFPPPFTSKWSCLLSGSSFIHFLPSISLFNCTQCRILRSARLNFHGHPSHTRPPRCLRHYPRRRLRCSASLLRTTKPSSTRKVRKIEPRIDYSDAQQASKLRIKFSRRCLTMGTRRR